MKRGDLLKVKFMVLSAAVWDNMFDAAGPASPVQRIKGRVTCGDIMMVLGLCEVLNVKYVLTRHGPAYVNTEYVEEME